jgi:hypothetical protein
MQYILAVSLPARPSRSILKACSFSPIYGISLRTQI